MSQNPAADDLCRAILSVYNGSRNPTKATLMEQRRQVIELLGDFLFERWQCPPLNVTLEDLEAYRVVLSYEGKSRFVLDLQRQVLAHGLLTQSQIEALMGPPHGYDLETLQRHDIDIPEHAWEAREIVNRLSREAAAQARALRAEGKV